MRFECWNKERAAGTIRWQLRRVKGFTPSARGSSTIPKDHWRGTKRNPGNNNNLSSSVCCAQLKTKTSEQESEAKDKDTNTDADRPAGNTVQSELILTLSVHSGWRSLTVSVLSHRTKFAVMQTQ